METAMQLSLVEHAIAGALPTLRASSRRRLAELLVRMRCAQCGGAMPMDERVSRKVGSTAWTFHAGCVDRGTLEKRAQAAEARLPVAVAQRRAARAVVNAARRRRV